MSSKKPPGPPRPPDRWRKYRQRQRNGERIAPVVYDELLLNFLTETGWLTEASVDDPCEVGAAIGRVMKDAAKHRPH